jgi:hypothetical protein
MEKTKIELVEAYQRLPAVKILLEPNFNASVGGLCRR